MVPRSIKDRVRENLLVKDEVFTASVARIDPGIETIFDVGANVGDVTLYMLEAFPRSTIYAFEPCSSSFAILSRRVAESGQTERVNLFNLGFYDAAGSDTLHITTHHGANSLVGITPEYREANPQVRECAAEQVALVRLDDFVAEKGIAHVDLMKIDVEGAESKVIAGGRKTLSTMVDAVMCEISFVRHPRARGEFIKVFQLLHDCGLAPAEIYDLWQSESGAPWRLGQFDCVFRRFDA